MSRYRGVWAAPHAPALLIASLVARLPYAINSLALILFVHEQTGSFARAGAVSASYAFAAGIGLPLLGRLVDRLGQRPVLLTAAALNAGATGGLVALGLADAGTGVLIAVAFVAGLCVPPVSPCIRGIWPQVLPDEEHMRSALALDAILLEVIFVGGPTLTAGIVAVASPAAALLTGIACTTAGTLAFAATPPSRAWRSTSRSPDWLGPLRSSGLRTLLLSSALLGFPIGVCDVALPAFGLEEGSRSLGGVFIAAMAAGSLIGGLWYGARARGGAVRAYVVLSLLAPVGFAAIVVADSTWSMLALAPLAGAVWAPLTTAENELAGEVAPAGTVTEAYAWLITGIVVGLAAGTAAAGAIVEQAGWREAVLVGTASALLGALVAAARRETLEPVAV